MDDSSCYTSKLAWIWVIEALASFKEVNFSILHDLIEMSPELPHNLGRNMREMLALRILEGLFGPSNGITNDSCSAPASKVGFDLSKSCEDVLQHIVHVTSQSGLRTAGPELLKWDVRPFIIHKRACMPKLALQQLKDSILEGSHPYTDYVKEKSGLAFTNAGEHCAEARTSSGPLLEKTGENESQCNFEHDVLLKAPQSASLDGAQQKIIDYEAEEDMDCCCEAGTSSDSDGYFNDHIDVSMKKHEFLSSQCTDTNLCVECNEGGQLLVCNTSHCPLVVHEICLGSSPRFDNSGNFYCPFCAYSLAISEYLEAKKKSSLARKELSKFVRMGLEHQQKEVLERLHREKHNLSRQNEDEDPLVKSHENGYLEERVSDQTDNDGGHVNEVNNLYFRGSIDHEQQAEPSASCDNVPSSVREEEATVTNGTLNVLTKEKEGEEKVIQPVSVLEGHHQQAADHECGGDNLSCRNTDVIPVNQRLVEEGIQQEVLEQQVADPTVEPVCALDIYAEDTSEDEKNKSIISNYSIRVRRQETHYKHPVSPQPRRNKVPWTAEEEVILKEGMRKFSNANDRMIPWKKILEFGGDVFLSSRTTIDLKDKWRNMCK